MKQRWEFGSEFDWPDLDDRPGAPILPEGAGLFGSGCHALHALLVRGMRDQGWRRCHVPAYFCQDVVAAIRRTGIQVELYVDSPLQPLPSLDQRAFQSTDVFLLVNYFGIRGPQAAESLSLGDAVLIEDHTHDPWSRWVATSRADYCVASLRKTLPLGHGAAIWSPQGHHLPESLAVAPRLRTAAHKKLAAMLMKRLYLRGESISKPLFRQLQLEAENELADSPLSGISPWGSRMLSLFPWEDWRTRRQANHRELAGLLTDLTGIRVVSHEFDPGSCPFSVILECESCELRDHLRSSLTAADIYPAVLWPHEDLVDPLARDAAELSRRMLAIACDSRYQQEDLQRVAEVVQEAVAAVVPKHGVRPSDADNAGRSDTSSRTDHHFDLPQSESAVPESEHGDRIYLSPPHMSQDSRTLLLEAFDSNWIAPTGPALDAFEREFAATVGVEHAVALNSGTAALHLALLLIGVKSGDEVITSTLTFSATANAIRYAGATPVFVDCERNTWNLDPDLLAEELAFAVRRGRPPKAVLVVDVFGQCADYGRIRDLCLQYHVPLIEDAAEALGATYDGHAAGTFGQIGCFSFNGNKIITTGGGGMLVTSRKDWADRARYLASQARDPQPHYEHSEVGYNYRMSNLLAAVGRGQLRELDDRIERRRAIFRFYEVALGDVPGIGFMPEHPAGRSSRWLTCITVDPEQRGVTRDDIRLALERQNIESRPVWKPMHLQPAFAGCRVRGGAVSEQLFRDGLCLPSGSNLGEKDLRRIVEVIRGVARPTTAVATPLENRLTTEPYCSRS
jgi:dTDP-4-amino-4,6-dideoxygalactose transaminase